MFKQNNTDSTIKWLFLTILSIYILVASGHYGGDALNNYLTTESIVIDRDLNIYDRDFDIEYIKFDINNGIKGKGGKLYSPFGIGMPILQMPLFLIGFFVSKIISNLPQNYITFFFVSFTNSIISTLNALLLFMLMLELNFKKKNAVILTLLYSFTTTAIVYSKTGFSEPALVTFLLIAILSIIRYFQSNHKKILLITSGAALGFMGLIKNYAIILLPAFILYFYIKNKNYNKFNIISFIISYLSIFVFDLYFNYIRFGDLFRSGYGNIAGIGLSYGNNFLKGLYYYWLSSGKGFFFYNIVLIPSLFLWRNLYSKKREEFWFFISLIFIYTLYFAYFFKRGSIFSWGPRYLFPITFIFILFMHEIFNKKIFIYFLIFISLVGFFMQFPAIIMNYSKYIYFVKEKLGLDEYLINFIPDLSPIKGCWQLFLSFFKKQFLHLDHVFVYSPDSLLVTPISSSLSGYDIVDLWFINIVQFKNQLIPIILSAVNIFFIFTVTSTIMLIRNFKKEE